MSARRLVLVSLLLLLAGCATPGKIKVGPFWAPKLSPVEQAAAEKIEAAVARMVILCEGRCATPTLFVVTRDVDAEYDTAANFLALPRRYLQPDRQKVGHVVVSHEIGHAFWIDGQACKPGNYAPCEWAANYHSVEVLVRGFGYDEDTAFRMVYAYLVSGLLNNKPSPGHEDLCRELHEYQRMAQWTTGPYPCVEKVTR
jgi:hypothetical protein